MIALLGSLVLGVVLAILMNWLAVDFFGEEKDDDEEEKLTPLGRAVAVGVIFTLVNFMTIKLPAGLAIILMLVPMYGMVLLFLWWRERGSTIKEALIFFIINLIVSVPLRGAAARIRDLTTIRWIIALFESLASIALIILIGCLIADVVWWNAKLNNGRLTFLEKMWKGGKR